MMIECILSLILGLVIIMYYDFPGLFAYLWAFLCLGTYAYFNHTAPLWVIVFSSVLLLFLLLQHVALLRYHMISRWLYALIRRHHKAPSKTEQIALSLGDPWCEASIFNGLWSKRDLEALTIGALNQEEQDFLSNETEQLCGLLDDWKIIHQTDIPKVIWDYLKANGFMGLMIDKSFGGKGFSHRLHAACVLKVATKSMTVAITMMVPNSLGPAELLTQYGTEKQRKKYLPDLASGACLPCFGLTEPEAGSDATSIKASGIVTTRSIHGKKVKGFLINFTKRYITLAPVADLIALAFHAKDPDHLLSDVTDLGITLILLPTDQKGVSHGKRHWPTALPFMNGTLLGKDVFVPLDAVIGGESAIGEGWRMLLSCLAVGRSISLPALSSATAQLSFLSTHAYVLMRHQFHHPLADFEGIQSSLLNISALTYLIESMRCVSLEAAEQGLKAPVSSAIVKYHSTEMARTVLKEAMDLHGGRALMSGPHNYLFPYYLASPIGITVEGANALTRHLMIFGQGCMIDHPYLKDMMQALSEPDTKVGGKQFNHLIRLWLAKMTTVEVRAYWAGLTAGYGLVVYGKEAELIRGLRRLSTAYAFSVEMALLFEQGKIKRKEKLSGYLADALGYLYAAHSSMVYHRSHGADADEYLLMDYAVKYSFDRATHALYCFWDCMPQALSKLVRFFLFPYGRPYVLNRVTGKNRLLNYLLKPSKLRDRFIDQGAYNTREELKSLFKGFDQYEAIKPDLIRLNQWLSVHAAHQILPVESQLEAAFNDNLFTQAQYSALKAFIALQSEAIAVDVFDRDLDQVVDRT